MRVLVTGATGFIGYEVARQLVTAGTETRLAVRRPIRGALVARLPAEIVAADLTRPASLERAVEGVDAVIHLGARAVFEPYARLRATIVEGSRSLARAAATAGVRRLVFGSSLFVYPSLREPIGRDTPAAPCLDYGRAKLEAESVLAEEAARGGMSLLSVRLPHVYGARDLFFARLARGRGQVAVPGMGANRFSHLHVADAARVLIAAAGGARADRTDADGASHTDAVATTRDAAGATRDAAGVEGALPVADRQPTTWGEYFAVLGEHFPQTRVVSLPPWMARAGARLLAPFLRLRSQPSMMTVDTVTGWNLNLEVDPGCLWTELGLEPRYPTITSGIPAALDECVAFRWVHPVEDTTGW